VEHQLVATVDDAFVSPSSAAPAPADAPADLAGGAPAPGSAAGEYAALKRLVVERGLLAPRPVYYGVMAAALLALFAGALALLVAAPSLWLRLVMAALLGFLAAQIAFVAHDIGHKQVLRGSRWGDLAGLAIGNLVLGISRSWWIDKHNAHHAHPNEIDADPDIDIPFVAFSESQALTKRGLARLVVSYQAFILFPVMFLAGAVSWRVYSLQTAFGGTPRYAWAERILLLGFFAWYLGLLVAVAGGWPAVLLFVVQQGMMGLYMGSVFAPNHKGMLVLEPGARLDFLRQQVLTSRNVRPSVLTDFLYGGLNYQIEHHLFPNLPRPSLRPARTLVREFCRQHGIGYHETGVRQSFREVLGFMHEIGAPLRRGDGGMATGESRA
jgi:fatty acid desaturase